MKPTALITGASGGIGYEMAKWFSKAGYELILVARSKEKLFEIKEELGLDDVFVIPQDLSYAGAASDLFEKVRYHGKTVEVLVNNAGFGAGGDFITTEFDKTQQLLQLNIQTLTELCHLFLPDMLHSPFKGVPTGILNIASIAAYLPGPKMATYHASKAYVLSFSEALAEELEDSPITISVLCPGPTSTNFFQNAQVDHATIEKNSQTPEEVAVSGFNGFIKGKRVIFPGLMYNAAPLVLKLVSRRLAAKLTKKFYSND
ncbi:SDR family NAD(P)-dependent oxidoreductase [Sediminibacillus massiliensis]|uniref:SDR family NAD(P)-dependent oxidoreductase n=1 Tax=Sediminibacillus massiliensis TaxID=1926277 RepID=UPI0009882F54|nr:SDR family oxidoreductase [Sediminibacillus massiliensis]